MKRYRPCHGCWDELRVMSVLAVPAYVEMLIGGVILLDQYGAFQAGIPQTYWLAYRYLFGR